MAEQRRRRGRGTRRLGYLVAAGVNALLWYLANVSPGWEAVPFLTAGTVEVLPLFNLALGVGLVSNLVYVLWDPPRLRALGDLVGAVVALALGVRVYRVFPFDFAGLSYDLTTLMRVVVVLGIIGSAIGILAALVALVRGRRAE